MAKYDYLKQGEAAPATPASLGAEKAAVDANWEAYARARDHGHLEFVREAAKHERYYVGDQWDPADISKLESEGRPHQTVNMVLSTVNAILGQHITNRQDIVFRPRGGGASEDVATALQSVIQQIQDNNTSKWVEQQVFMDGVIEDRGFFDIRIDFSDNIYGEVRETALSPRDVLLPPTGAEYDPRTWPEIIVTRWLTVDEIQEMYGKAKADEVRKIARRDSFGVDSVDYDRQTFAGDTSTFGTVPVPEDKDENDAIQKVRVLERQHRKLHRRRHFVDLINGDTRPVPDDWEEQKVSEFAASYGLTVIDKVERRVRWTVTADQVLLYDDWSLYDDFTVVPFFPYFRRGKPFGVVRNLLSPQDTLNKVTSQELHVVNTTANSGWIFQSGSLVDMDRSDLERDGAKTGFVFEYQKGFDPPVKIQPNQVPTGLAQVSQKAEFHFRTISGVPEGMMGIVTRETSGDALQQQNANGLAQLEIVFDNLAKTRHIRARTMLGLIQRFYTEERVLHVTKYDELGDEYTEEVAINQRNSAGELINDLTLGEYSVVISSQQTSDVVQDAVFEQMMAMRDRGIPIPSYLVVKNSRMPMRERIAEIVKSLEGLADPSEEELQMQAQQQALQMQAIEANVRMMMAKAMEHEARAMLAAAQAGAAEQAPMLEMQKIGAQLRQDMEKFAGDMEKSRSEMQTRLRISAEKNQKDMFVAQVGSMTKRVEAAGNERQLKAQLESQERQAEMKAKAAAKKAAQKPKPKAK
jgi:hypothetical protein